jgi:hypothetical protein
MFNKPLRDDVEKAGEKKEESDSDIENGKKLANEAKNPKDAMHVVREGSATDLNVFIRGNVENKGPVVPRHFLRVLCDGEPTAFASGSGRRELAEAIASPENPLAARVIVNRVWARYMGRPLVATPSNFGARGELPSHPELLDDLAVRFMDNGWSLKWLAREIVLSSTYRQSSQADAAPLAADPENVLLSRMNRRRMTVEQWRDAILAAAGQLECRVGGPSLDPQDPAQHRRTIYSHASRLELNRMLAMFDYPDPNVHADHRALTTTPLQKMFVLNSPFMVAEARALAERLQSESLDDAHRIEFAYRLLYARSPTDEEIELGKAFVNVGGDAAGRWQRYAQVLLAANELLYVD